MIGSWRPLMAYTPSLFIPCAPTIATVLASPQELCRRLGVLAFRGIGAAFGDQKIHQPLHHLVVGVTYERSCFPHLRDQTDQHPSLDVVGERGGCDLQLLLQATDRQPRGA